MPDDAAATAPLITVGMPVYNSERYVAQAIESMLAQTHRDFVLVICDNASTDGTREICERYARQDSRVQYYPNPVNLGMSSNFNRCFELARTKYIKWATADDYSAPEMLADALAVLESDPSVALCYPRTVVVDENGNEQDRYEDKLHLMQNDPVERFLTLIREIGLVNHHYGLVRTETIRKTRLYGPHVGADVGFLAELCLYGKFFGLPKFQFFRRFHPDSSSWKRSDDEHQKRRFHPAKGHIAFNYWRYHAAYFGAIHRSPLPLPRKVRVFRILLKMLYWKRKPLGEEFLRDLPQLLSGRR